MQSKRHDGSSSLPKLLGFVVAFLQIVSCQATWDHQKAWVAKLPCGPLRPYFPASSTSFWISSLRGEFTHEDGATKLSLSILGVQNETLFDCQQLDIAALNESLGFQTLGYPVGRVESFNATCPLPITDDLTPRPTQRFNLFEIVYSFNHPHRLQTLAAQFLFKAQDGGELDCAVAEITPYIGRPASAVFTYLPAGVLALVGLSSWQTHVLESHFLDYASALTSQHGPAWETILDVSVYLRYLQSVFLSASLSIHYPGFYQPIVGRLSWASLLYWSGPFDGGFVWKGVDGGFYVSNHTYGLDYMGQMLGIARMENTVFDVLLNLLILVVALFCILCIAYALNSKSSPKTRWLAATGMIARMSASICLSIFSMPLLAYMSYEWIFVGYFSNYRIVLVTLTVPILLFSHYVITQPFWNHQVPIASSADKGRDSRPASNIGMVVWCCSRYLPHFIPLLQAIFVGALQDFGVVQVVVLPITEALFLIHSILNRKTELRFFHSKSVWLSVFRLVAHSLCITMVCSPSEAVRQGVGYAMLCLHGVIIFPFFLIGALSQLYRARKKRNREGCASTLEPGDNGHLLSSVAINLDDISSHFVYKNRRGRTARNSRAPQQHSPGLLTATNHGSSGEAASSSSANDKKRTTAFSSTPRTVFPHDVPDFYRRPRTRNTTPTPFDSVSSVSSASSPSSIDTSPTSTQRSAQLARLGFGPAQQSHDEQSVFSEISIQPGVDYAVRESDRFYGAPLDDESTPPSSTPASSDRAKSPSSSRTALYSDFTSRVTAFVKPKRKEKGFHVVRPHLAGQDLARLQQGGAIRLHECPSGTDEFRVDDVTEEVEREEVHKPVS